MPRPPSSDPRRHVVKLPPVRLTADEYALLKRLAREDGRTMGSQLAALGRQWLQEKMGRDGK